MEHSFEGFCLTRFPQLGIATKVIKKDIGVLPVPVSDKVQYSSTEPGRHKSLRELSCKQYQTSCSGLLFFNSCGKYLILKQPTLTSLHLQ